MVVEQVERRGAREILADTRAAVDPPYRSAVWGLPAELRTLLGYHAGWWDADQRPTQPTGKAFAPSLALLCAEAVAGHAAAARAVALNGAVAVEMVHDASLLHDDIVDADHTRRHRPAAWRVFGTGPALFAGVALMALAAEQLDGIGATTLCATVRRIYEGQIDDGLFEDRSDVSPGQYLRMVEKKTAALLETACGLGARLAGADQQATGNYREFGRCLGIAYQIRDDILGIWGDPEVTGKPARSDLVSRKKTAPVLAALADNGRAGRQLAHIYRQDEQITPEQAEAAAALIDAAGGRQWAEQEADRWTHQADQALERAHPGPAAQALRTLATAALRRDH